MTPPPPGSYGPWKTLCFLLGCHIWKGSLLELLFHGHPPRIFEAYLLTCDKATEMLTSVVNIFFEPIQIFFIPFH